MLSSALRSKRAISVNIEITRAFVRLRQMLASNAELSRRLDDLEGISCDRKSCKALLARNFVREHNSSAGNDAVSLIRLYYWERGRPRPQRLAGATDLF